MFVLMTYDVHSRRVAKAMKVARRYLRRVQDSVFEGELTPGGLSALKRDLDAILDPDYDSVLFYTWREPWQLSRDAIGPIQTAERSNFI